MKNRRLKNVLGIIVGVPLIVVCNAASIFCKTASDIDELFYNINHDEIEEESE